MIAALTALTFALALVLHLAGGHEGLVLDLIYGGLLGIALHLAIYPRWPLWWRQAPPRP